MDAAFTPDSRLPDVGVTVFTVMTRLAGEHGAINLSQGFPDFDCAPELVATVAAIFTRHGFEVHENVSGYAGGNIVTTYGSPRTRRVHAIQLEINASLLMTTTREEFIAQVSRGAIPEKAEANIARLRLCLREVLAALPAVLATVHEGQGSR